MRKVIIVAAAALLLAQAVAAQSTGPAMRTFAGFRLGGGFPESGDFGTGGSFETDPKIADSYYIGPVSSYQSRELPDATDVDQFISGIRAAYGRGQVETGLMLPYIRNLVHGGGHEDRHGLGDLQIYGKVVPIQLDGFDAAAGMTLIAPTGSESKHLGYGEWGFLPFASAALHIPGNPLELRGMFGYRFFADDYRTTFAITDAPGDPPRCGKDAGLLCSTSRVPGSALVYRGGLSITPNEYFGVRCDVAGESIDVAGPSSPLAVEPGFEIRVPAKVVDIVIQPT
ncbi:MAG TPA: hypothetical protein VEB21_06965, partial [Terriglobales bacterium]|nr:hypothetical protein [Terriglobales bacterium]